MSLLYDEAFEALREFLVDIHYTHFLDDAPTALSSKEWQVYVKPTNLLISNVNKQECTTLEPDDNNNLVWWDHRRIILDGGTTKREGVWWLWQVQDEMEELAHRYPEATMVTRDLSCLQLSSFAEHCKLHYHDCRRRGTSVC
jgi:hypothetical protein